MLSPWSHIGVALPLLVLLLSCNSHGARRTAESSGPDAATILGDSTTMAISFGGYRHTSRDIQPTLAELKEDLLILSAMGIRLLRTYNVTYDEVPNLLQAIRELKRQDPKFEMYLMLGAWIDCKNAWTDLPPDHNEESEKNADEIERAVRLAQQYPDIVKMVAVGNEAMVQWATAYYVHPRVILKWVRYLQQLKAQGVLPSKLWITSSDNFASWGGGDASYHIPELEDLMRAVDFVSMHTYPMHDTHYNPQFWGVLRVETQRLDEKQQVEAAMLRARDYAVAQYQAVADYMRSLGIEKPIHIGETGWASQSNELYGPEGSKATDEYKAGLYYRLMRRWSHAQGVTCFYFEAFDEPWKDANHPGGSENHFGLFNLQAQAKYALWDLVDAGVFKRLTRDGKPIAKTYAGRLDSLWRDVAMPPTVERLNLPTR